MKPLIFFFWFFLITMSLMAKELLAFVLCKHQLIIDGGYNYFVFELRIKTVDKYIFLTNWKCTNFIFFKETLFYGKGPPDDRYPEVKKPGQLLERAIVGKTSVSKIIVM